jgi:hypothetical protein
VQREVAELQAVAHRRANSQRGVSGAERPGVQVVDSGYKLRAVVLARSNMNIRRHWTGGPQQLRDHGAVRSISTFDSRKHRRRTVIGVGMSHRAYDGILIKLPGEIWNQLRNGDSRNRCLNRPKGPSHIVRGIRLRIECFKLAWPAIQPDKDARASLLRVVRTRRDARSQHQARRAHTCRAEHLPPSCFSYCRLPVRHATNLPAANLPAGLRDWQAIL